MSVFGVFAAFEHVRLGVLELLKGVPVSAPAAVFSFRAEGLGFLEGGVGPVLVLDPQPVAEAAGFLVVKTLEPSPAGGGRQLEFGKRRAPRKGIRVSAPTRRILGGAR